MTTWDFKETYTLIRSAFGHKQLRLARESMQSVNDRKEFSSYHFSEAMRLSKAFERKHLAGARTLLEIHGKGAERKRVAFEAYIIKAGAHSVAAVQSLHAIPDIFAHAVYFSTGQNLQPDALSEPDISLPRVSACLKRDKAFAILSKPMESIQSGTGWRHLAAVSNMSKHRSVVRAKYSEDWTGTRPNYRELQVDSFERHGKKYPAKSLRELVEPEYDRLLNQIITIGHELNVCLGNLTT
jgi:hypothetical protein